MVQQLTPSQQKWYDLAAQHADVFAERAAEYDREGKFPFENFDDMKASGYTAMPVPADCNGGGADAPGYVHRPEPAGPRRRRDGSGD